MRANEITQGLFGFPFRVRVRAFGANRTVFGERHITAGAMHADGAHKDETTDTSVYRGLRELHGSSGVDFAIDVERCRVVDFVRARCEVDDDVCTSDGVRPIGIAADVTDGDAFKIGQGRRGRVGLNRTNHIVAAFGKRWT